MPALKNAKRERFCLEYVKDFNGARAARDAGYSEKTAKAAACQLMTFPDVKERVAELKDETWREAHMGRQEVLGRLAKEARGVEEESRPADRIKALEILGRHHGIYQEDNRQQGEAGARLVELLAEAALKSGGVGGLLKR